MKIAIVGGGVIGVTTAYYLARDGHEVTVLEKQHEVGQDATGGNAGLIAPGHSFAWASPQAPRMLLKSLRGEATAIRVKFNANPRFLWWGMQFLRECTTRRARINTLAKLELCEYSQTEMYRLADAEAIDYDVVQRGAVYLYRDEHELELGLMRMKLLTDAGQEVRRLTPEELVALDPSFANAAPKLTGAIHAVKDGSGNSEKFTRMLADICQKKFAVRLETGISVSQFKSDGRRVTSVVTDRGEINADAYVLAAGVYSPELSRTIGQDLPIYPAKGYSATVDVSDPERAPTVGGVDEKTLVAWSRFGTKLRLSSTAEFAGYGREWRVEDFSNIFSVAKDLWPGAADWENAALRSCLRPMTPDGPPIIGLGQKHDNFFYNTGHGHMGWTMACGSSLMLADMIAGRTPAVSPKAFVVRNRRKGK